MAYAVQFRRGTTAEHSTFTGEIGEVTVNTDTNSLVVHDGTTAGGHTQAAYTDSDVSTFLNGNVDGHIKPDTNEAYDLGSPEKKFRDLYLSAGTIHIGDKSMSSDNVDRSMEVYNNTSAPSSPNSDGNKGDVRVVGEFMYVCIAPNIWVRSVVQTSW